MNPKENERAAAEFDWDATSWEGARRRQLQKWAALTLDEIFAAQEDMSDFARAMAAPNTSRSGADARHPGI